MAIKSRANQYRGVNPHFTSAAQHENEGWVMFHTGYIVALGTLIDPKLPTGYEVEWETSLQIREYDPDTGEPIHPAKNPIPDLTIWDTTPNAMRSGAGVLALGTPTMVKPAIEMLSEDPAQFYKAMVVYEVNDENRIPVARFELLSPSNKPGGSGFEQYIAKQNFALRAGKTSLVIIDFLHESESPIPKMPSYPHQQLDSYPYTITVIDPRPNLQKGEGRVYGFSVDDPIPAIDIPLAGKDVVRVDFGLAYNNTYQAVSRFSNRVDYSLDPEAIETYTRADQERIRARMQVVKDAHAQSLNLETIAPLAIES